MCKYDMPRDSILGYLLLRYFKYVDENISTVNGISEKIFKRPNHSEYSRYAEMKQSSKGSYFSPFSRSIAGWSLEVGL